MQICNLLLMLFNFTRSYYFCKILIDQTIYSVSLYKKKLFVVFYNIKRLLRMQIIKQLRLFLFLIYVYNNKIYVIRLDLLHRYRNRESIIDSGQLAVFFRTKMC